MSKYPRGSEWRRWDLHVHSPLSILANNFPTAQGQPDWDRYVEALEAQPISVFGITDYFTIDGYKHLRRLQKEAGRLPGKLLLPNIEFRLDRLINARGEGHSARRLNFHVVFSEDVEPTDIEDHFLHDLNFVYEQNPTDHAKRKRLKPANLRELGEQLKSEDASFTTSPLEVGATTAIVALEDILDTLKANDRFRDKYLLILPAENWDQISWGGQDHLVRKTLLQAAHVVMASNPRTINWCLGDPPYSEGPSNFVREFGSLKPCMHGSDAHAIGFIGHPCAKRSDRNHSCERDRHDCDLRNCWVKADPTFEGLRQALYEPKDRVRIQAQDPTPTKSIFSLGQIAIPALAVNQELSVSNTEIPLNAGLVAVTGGKGSGKTALVDLIASAFVPRETSADRNSFVRRIAPETNKLAFTLQFAGGDSFAKKVGDGRHVEQSTISYIAQGELESYIDENSDLNDYVHRLIFGSAAVKDTVDAFDYQSLESKTASLEADLAAKNQAIHLLEQSTSSSIQAELERKGKQTKAELGDTERRIAALEQNLSKDKVEANAATQKAAADEKARRDTLARALQLIDNTLRSLDNELQKIASGVRELNAVIGRLDIGEPLPVPTYPERERLTDLRKQIEVRLASSVAAIELREKEVRKLADEVQEHSKALARRQELTTLHATLQEQWRQLQAQREQLEEHRRTRTQLTAELLRTTLQQREQYSKIIATFGAAKERILTDLDFRTHVTVEWPKLLESMRALLDNRQVEVDGNDRAASEFEALKAALTGLVDTGEGSVSVTVDEIDRLASTLAPKLKTSISPDALYAALYRSYLAVHPVVLYKNTALDRLSLGQKATVLMKIYLAEGGHPIIIDSHDDHLDNEYIMDELVGAIRHAKGYRQVILASNNGNVVVNSDAEQVIVAQRTNGTISYLAGSLENPDIRKKALRVLEGGEDAFKKRQAKYRMA